MDLSLTESQKMFKSTARDFFKQECPWALMKEIDESENGFSAELFKKVADMGWLGMILPESCGGMGCNLLDLAVIYEEMGQALLPGVFFNSSVLCGSVINEIGTNSQKQELLPVIGSGNQIFTLAFTEKDYGWGPESITLSAVSRGDKYILNGNKRFVPDAQVADWFICVARTAKGSSPEESISLFLVDKNAPGLTCRLIKGFTGEKLYDLTFNSVEVPAANLVGPKDKAWQPLSKAFSRAVVILCSYMVGGCQYLLDLTVQYAQTRVQFGQPIGAFQWVQGYIIEQANQLERARWFTYEAIWKLDVNKPEAEQNQAVAMAKVVCSEAFLECGHLSHEVHAGIGVDKKYPLYLWSKKSKTLFSYLGDPAFHKKRIAQALGL